MSANLSVEPPPPAPRLGRPSGRYQQRKEQMRQRRQAEKELLQLLQQKQPLQAEANRLSRALEKGRRVEAGLGARYEAG
eukprot:COSAG01_NODE_4923_length_4615_cov_3.525232_2_plen_79_part_00